MIVKVRKHPHRRKPQRGKNCLPDNIVIRVILIRARRRALAEKTIINPNTTKIMISSSSIRSSPRAAPASSADRPLVLPCAPASPLPDCFLYLLFYRRFLFCRPRRLRALFYWLCACAPVCGQFSEPVPYVSLLRLVFATYSIVAPYVKLRPPYLKLPDRCSSKVADYTKTTVTAQNTETILTSRHPHISKWWWIGLILKIRFPRQLKGRDLQHYRKRLNNVNNPHNY